MEEHRDPNENPNESHIGSVVGSQHDSQNQSQDGDQDGDQEEVTAISLITENYLEDNFGFKAKDFLKTLSKTEGFTDFKDFLTLIKEIGVAIPTNQMDLSNEYLKSKFILESIDALENLII